MRHKSIRKLLWAWAGSVPLRHKIIGIIIAPMMILGFTIAWWVSNQLGGWLSYLLTEERVAQAMAIGMRSVSIITILSAIAGLAIGLLLTWVLTRPILEMTYIARRVKNGDLAVTAPVWANDEIGELGRAFNDMIESLSASRQEFEQFNEQLWHRNRELAILYKLADMANQFYTPQQASEQGLIHTLESTGASAGLIVTLSDNTYRAVIASHKLPDEFLQKAVPHLPIDEDILNGNDYASRIIPDVNEATALSAELIIQCQRLGYYTMVLVPIVNKKHLLGVLMMLAPDASMVTVPQYHALIAGICNQLGIMIQNTQLWEELRHKEQLRAQLLNKIVTAQEEERQRISRELHDETGQALTSLLVQLKILERSDNVAEIKAQTEDIRQLTVHTLQEVRRLAADLRPAALDDLGLISALESYIYNYASKTNIVADFEVKDMDDIRLAHDVEIVLYRIVQEALTNIARHAQAQRATVLIQRQHDHICVTIEDDGSGFDVHSLLQKQDRGLGILGMQERIQLIGGTFMIQSAPRQGTKISLKVLIPPNDLEVAP